MKLSSIIRRHEMSTNAYHYWEEESPRLFFPCLRCGKQLHKLNFEKGFCFGRLRKFRRDIISVYRFTDHIFILLLKGYIALDFYIYKLKPKILYFRIFNYVKWGDE